MQWALKPRTFTWEANARSPIFCGTCDAENQIGCAPPPEIWPKPWKAIGRGTGTLEANSAADLVGHALHGESTAGRDVSSEHISSIREPASAPAGSTWLRHF